MCWKSNFTRTHRTIFLVVWAIFATLTFAVTAMNVPHGPDDYGQVIAATIGTLAGPMPCALSRGCQSCCLRFSLSLFPYAGAALLLAVVPQFVPWGPGRFGRTVRLVFLDRGMARLVRDWRRVVWARFGIVMPLIQEMWIFVRRHWWHLLLLIPGAVLVTILHEATHAVAILVQGGTVREFVWLPERGSWGHVAYDFPPGAGYSRTIVALAPTALWLSLAVVACLLCLRTTTFSYRSASVVFLWLFVIPLADVAHAAFPFLAGGVNDYASAFGRPAAASAVAIAIATIVAWMSGYFVQLRLYREHALTVLAYAILSTVALLMVFGVTVGLGI